MGLFSKRIKSKEDIQIIELKTHIDQLLNTNDYIARSQYSHYIEEYKSTADYFNVLKTSETLKKYCRKNKLKYREILTLLDQYDQIHDVIKKHNDKYIKDTIKKEKDYLDHILYDVDPQIILDDDQRRVVLTDEDYSLVIAGAGAGKTTTIAAKVKYLVEKKSIDPKDILVLSFTNKAVKELKDKLNKDLGLDVLATTFHSIGYAILKKENEQKMQIASTGALYYILQNYFKDKVLKDEKIVRDLILFFSTYFDAPYEEEELNSFFNNIANYTTMRSELNDFKKEIIDSRSKKKITIQNEYVRSLQEVEIANFLYLNQIDYEYEPIYPYYMPNTSKPYTPDFMIRQGNKICYIEHFGISQTGYNHLYDSIQLEQYKKAVKDKIQFHKTHGTPLIFTFSSYTDKKSLLSHLETELVRCGFVLNKRDDLEVFEKIVSNEENKYIKKLIQLMCRFINNFKTNGYTLDDFDKMYYQTNNVRNRLFLNIAKTCFIEYENYLKQHNSIDFQDMINRSSQILKEFKETKQYIHYKYIIVDEYQDISKQRFNLVQAIKDVSNAKIIAVGDDWQSIYAFSGSDITLFTKFKELVGYAELLKIVKTYRNSQEVIDIAGTFVQKNTSQITKRLLSVKHIKQPVIIYPFENNKDYYINLGLMIEKALEHIIKNNPKDNIKILLLGRFGFDGKNLEKSGLFEFSNYGSFLRSKKYKNIIMTYMTVHSSKGLGYDEVIIINGKNDLYGFPSKIEDDPVLSFVVKEDHSIDYAEERRLFYVAMTRTKNRVYIIAPDNNPSEFILELIEDYKNIKVNGKLQTSKIISYKKRCPICGYPLQYRYKYAYGLKLYICTNEPELCSYMSNKPDADILSIMKCNQCHDGYLIVKETKKHEYFLGCTNFKPNKKGCNNTVSLNKYHQTFIKNRIQ